MKEPFGQERLADDVVTELRRRGVTEITYDAAAFSIRYDGPNGGSAMFLHNLFAECEQDPDRRTPRIERFVSVFLSIGDGVPAWEHARSLLRPVLRGSGFGQGAGVPGPLRRPALPFVDRMVVVDMPASMAYVTGRTVTKDWAVSETEVFAAADRAMTANADRRIGPDDEQGALFLVDDGDSYWVSHLLVEGWLARVGERLAGRPVAFAPDANTLLVLAADSPALGRGYEFAMERYEREPRSLSPVGYTVDGAGRLVPYQVPDGHPLAHAVGTAVSRLALDGYGAQRDTDGAPEFVARCMSAQRPDGSSFTFATWSDGQPTLLPRVDVLALSEGGGTPLFVPFGAAVETGLVAEAVEYHPVRYRTAWRPAAEALAALRERAVTP